MPMAPEDGSWASAKAMHRTLFKSALRHILQLPVDSPCPCLHNTTPSWAQTSPPSNWRIQRRNRTAQMMSRTHRPGLGNPFREPCSTILFSPHSSPPASLRIHHCSCKDLQAVAAMSAAQVGGWAPAVGRSVGIHDDGYGSTTISCPRPKCPLHQLRS